MREKERKERLGNFLWDQTKIAKECECGDLERERDGFLHPHLAAEKQSDPRTTLGTLWSEAVHAFVKLAWLPHRLSSACFGIFVLLLLTHYALHHYSPLFSIPTSPSQPALQLLLVLVLVPVLLLSLCPAPGTQSYKPQWLAVGSEDCLEEDFGSDLWGQQQKGSPSSAKVRKKDREKLFPCFFLFFPHSLNHLTVLM